MPTSIPFQNVPSDILTPLFYAEIDPSFANTAVAVQRTLIIGQKTNLGSGKIDGVTRISGSADGIDLGGPNSLAAQMVDAYRANDTSGEVYLATLKDNVAGTFASGTIQFTAAATAAGTYTVYIGGTRYQIAVTSSLTTTQLATALAAAINADKRATVTAAAATGTVTLTANHKGPLHNDFPIYEYYGGKTAGEVAPAGLTTVVTAMSGGTLAPDLTTMLANCGDLTFDFIACPYTDSTSLNLLQAFLNDSTGRWSYAQQLFGHVFTAYKGTVTQLVNNIGGAVRNNQHESVMGWNAAGSPAWVLAAAYCGTCAASLRIDPARPLQTLPIYGVLPPKKADRFNLTDRNTLLHNGVATFTVGDDGTMRVENVVTTYQVNAYGAADNSYREVETMFTLAYVIRDMRSVITTKFARMKLAANATRFAGNGVVTPNMIRAELIAEFYRLQDLGLVQAADQFAAGLVVQQNAQNPDRVDVLWPGTLIDQLRIFAALIQFRRSPL